MRLFFLAIIVFSTIYAKGLIDYSNSKEIKLISNISKNGWSDLNSTFRDSFLKKAKKSQKSTNF